MHHVAHLKWADGRETIQEFPKNLPYDIRFPVYEPPDLPRDPWGGGPWKFISSREIVFKLTGPLTYTAGCERGYYKQVEEVDEDFMAYRDSTPGIWIGSNGKEIPIFDLDSAYLANIIRKLEREGKTNHPRYDELLEEAANRMIKLDGKPQYPQYSKQYGKGKLPPLKVNKDLKPMGGYFDDDVPF